MELDQVELCLVDRSANLLAGGVDEQTYFDHSGRQGGDDLRGPIGLDEPRAVWIEVQSNCVGPGSSRGQRVVDVGDAANLDAKHEWMWWICRLVSFWLVAGHCPGPRAYGD